MRIIPAIWAATVALAIVPVAAQQIALVPANHGCADAEPDMVQISWDSPCEEGNWLLEPGVGCRTWDWHPDESDKGSWTGACHASTKEGHGVAQWTEHGQPIDRFEGTYRNGRREGSGRYVWDQSTRFDGTYEGDLPNGFGKITVNGITLAGEWRNGCLKVGDKAVAIGVPLASCATEPDDMREMAALPDQEILK